MLYSYMLYILAAIIIVLVVIIFWQSQRRRELSASIQSLQSNLDRTRSNLASDELESNELEHQLTMLRIEIGSLKGRLETLQHYQHILDVEQYVLERRQQVEMFVEMIKSEAENTREQCKQQVEKVRDFLAEHEQKTKAKTLKTAQDQLGAFYNLVEERQQLEQIMTALYHKIEHHTPAFQLPAQQLVDDLIEGYLTQCWLAVSNDDAVQVSGGYWHHHECRKASSLAYSSLLQDNLIDKLSVITNISLFMLRFTSLGIASITPCGNKITLFCKLIFSKFLKSFCE